MILSKQKKIVWSAILILVIANIASWLGYDDVAIKTKGSVKSISSMENEVIDSNMLSLSDILKPYTNYIAPKRDIFRPTIIVSTVVKHIKPPVIKPKKMAPTAMELKRAQVKNKLNKIKLVGIARKNALLNAFLVFEDQDLTVIIGDKILNEFKILEITDKQVKIRHIKTKIERTVVIGK